MKSLDDIYARCNFCVMELENFVETHGDIDWRKEMKEEIQVIEKKKHGNLSTSFLKRRSLELIGFTK